MPCCESGHRDRDRSRDAAKHLRSLRAGGPIAGSFPRRSGYRTDARAKSGRAARRDDRGFECRGRPGQRVRREPSHPRGANGPDSSSTRRNRAQTAKPTVVASSSWTTTETPRALWRGFSSLTDTTLSVPTMALCERDGRVVSSQFDPPRYRAAGSGRLSSRPGATAAFCRRRPRARGVTGYGGESNHSRARLAGFDHFLVKPVNLGAFKQMLAGLAQSPSIAPAEAPTERTDG